MQMPIEISAWAPVRAGVVEGVDGPVVVLNGDLDVRSTQEVRALIYDLIARHELVVVDMRGVGAIDITALRLLAVATREAARHGHRLRLRGCGPAVRRMVHLARLAHALDVERDLVVV